MFIEEEERLENIIKQSKELHFTSNMSKLITVFGATGNQGGSVIKDILEDPQLSREYKIRGITRDTSKKSAQELVKQGVEVVSVRVQTSPSLRREFIYIGRFELCQVSRPCSERDSHCFPSHQLLGDRQRRH